MNMILTLEGGITTVTPFTVQIPNKQNEFPLSVDGLPMIQSSTIRGWLRHSVHNAITDLAYSQGINYDVAQHHFMGLGLDVHNQLSKISNAERKRQNIKLKDQNPFFAVFGRWLSGGRLVVNNAVADRKDAVVNIGSTSSTNILKSDPHLLQQIDPTSITDLDSVLFARTVSKDSKQSIKSEIKHLQEKLNQPDLDPNFAKLIQGSIKSLEKNMNEIYQHGDAYTHRKIKSTLALAENVHLQHSMRLNNPSERDFIFLMWAIFTASKQPIGGKVGQGFGQICFEWNIYSESLFDIKRNHIGKVGFNHNDGFYLSAIDDLETKQRLLKKDAFNIEFISKRIAEKCVNLGKFN